MTCYREVLQANNTALGLVARIQEALAGERAVTAAESRQLVAGVTVQTFRMITNLNRMTGDRFPVLVRRFHDLRGRISGQTEVTPYLGSVGFTVPLADVGAEMAEVVGQKSAFLGEAHRLLPGRVPEGFATTEPAYREFIARSGLSERIAGVMATLDASDTAASFSAAARITQMIESAPVPAALATALEAGAASLGAGGRRFVVRWRALQEGGLDVSFAGQYRVSAERAGERNRGGLPPGGGQ